LPAVVQRPDVSPGDHRVDDPDPFGVPTIGLGTWQHTDYDQCVESVRTALELGYRHVDTAQAYGNEAAVGEGLAAADVDRDDVLLATKVWIDRLSPADVHDSTAASLDRLGVDSVDVLYVHWPAGDYESEATLSAFETLRERGHIDHVGVSNFDPEHLEAAGAAIDAPIVANQVEMHPLLQQAELREYCADADIDLVAYSPLARGRVFDLDVVTEVAETHDASAAQVSLAWLHEKGVAAIPKATGREHVADNRGSLDVELTDEDVARIDAIDREERVVHPEFAPEAW
jgi:diketogulonate reductase-like aldo/keto reductase